MTPDRHAMVNQLALTGSVISAALAIQPAVEYGSGLLIFIIVLLLAVAGLNIYAIIVRST